MDKTAVLGLSYRDTSTGITGTATAAVRRLGQTGENTLLEYADTNGRACEHWVDSSRLHPAD